MFGLRSESEAGRALELLNLDPDDRLLRDSLLEFDTGRCLMRDHRGRVQWRCGSHVDEGSVYWSGFE